MKWALAILFSLWASTASANVPCTLPFNLQNNTTADATQVMANYNALVACLTNAAGAGVNTDITALTALSTPIPPASGGSNVYAAGTSTGSANAQAVSSTTPTGFTLVRGNRVTFIAGFTNNASLLLNVNATGSISVVKPTIVGTTALTGGEVVLGNYIEAVFNGTNFELYTNPSPNAYGPLTVVAGASTTDLGAAVSHNIAISGAATINSFGTTASTISPMYRVLFSGASTLVNGVNLILPGAANIVTRGGDGAVAQIIGAGQWQVVSYQRADGTAIVNPTSMSGVQGLLVTNNTGTPNTNIDISADQALLLASGPVPIYVASAAVTINTTTTGANGLDTGSRASSTWYNMFLISNGSVTAGLASLSATTPTLPSGYIYSVRVGAMRTDGSGNFLRTRQMGAHTEYTTGGISMVTGSNSAWTAIAVGNYVPPTATQIKGIMSAISMGNNTTVSVAPSNSYPTGSVGNAATTPWSITNSTGAANGLSAQMTFEMILQTTNIYYGSTAGSATAISALGWTDKVNAN